MSESHRLVSLNSDIVEKIKEIQEKMPGDLNKDKIISQALDYYKDRKVLKEVSGSDFTKNDDG